MTININDGWKLLQALGLEHEKVRRATVHFAPGEPVIIVAEVYVDSVDADEAGAIATREFHLVPIESEKQNG